MIRLFVTYVAMVIAVIMKVLSQGDVSVALSAPNEVVAGTEFEVQVTIDKGELESYSRLLQNIPAGLKASSGVTSDADFSYKDKRARFMWMNLPDDEQFVVSYRVKVDQRLKGTFSIDGKFSYIEDNERRSISANSNEITILPSPDIDPSLIVDINDYEKLIIPYILPAFGDPKIACIRQTPIKDGNGYIVNLIVSKERKEKFAKIEEKIPQGFTAESITDRDATFTYSKGTAKFLWMNIPASAFFKVSYRLIPTSSAYRQPELDGTFSYLEDEKTISIDIQQTKKDLAEVKTPEDLYMLMAGIASENLASTPTPKDANTQNTETDTKVIDVPVANNTRPRDLKSNNRFQLEPEDGVYYRVQLAAGHKPVSIRRYFKKYKLDKEVRKEYHDGWHKYSIGSFADYKAARDYRVHIWNTTVIDDAFVSAYNDGSRITVQEALMVANQKWYK